MSLAQNITNVFTLQNTQLANDLNAVRQDPSKLAQFVAQRKGDLYTTVTQEHSDNFQKTFGDLQRSSDTTKNILYYHVRNKDLDSVQQAVYGRAKQEADAVSFNNQNAKRQFEMNEWTANNKQDTLFILQLTFISLTILAPMLFLQRLGLIPTSVFYGISSLLIIALILTVAVRAQYTEKSRDNRYWNRRRFQQMGGPQITPVCPDATAATQNLIASGQTAIERGLEMGSDFKTRFETAAGAFYNPQGEKA
jgi:hypothetical protein